MRPLVVVVQDEIVGNLVWVLPNSLQKTLENLEHLGDMAGVQLQADAGQEALVEQLGNDIRKLAGGVATLYYTAAAAANPQLMEDNDIFIDFITSQLLDRVTHQIQQHEVAVKRKRATKSHRKTKTK